MKTIIILGNARCYHTMDWYRAVKELHTCGDVIFVTDLINSEGHKVIISKNDKVFQLVNIDRFLLKKQSRFGNLWRNGTKFLFLPLQLRALKKVLTEFPGAIVHAHTMYYMVLAWLAGINYIGTPQGSEILVRPHRSAFYKYFARKALASAKQVTVDSCAMAEGVAKLSGKTPFLLQNGVDLNAISASSSYNPSRNLVCSMRGLAPLYRINEILNARNKSIKSMPLTLIYPFWNEQYKSSVIELSIPGDRFLGRVDRDQMYKLFRSSFLAISIPSSDSSPRSVYEAIFCGCCVAVVYNRWIEMLPLCMKNRLFIVDLKDSHWFEKAVNFGASRKGSDYIPSPEALEDFDQYKSSKKLMENIYGLTEFLKS